MSNGNQARRETPVTIDTLIHHLETLSHSLLFVNDAATILYANPCAQTMIGASTEEVYGKSLWYGAPQLMSRALYYAMRRAQQIQALTEVQYRSSLTQSWLQVQLSPAPGGLLLQFQEERAPAQHLQESSPHQPLCVELLNGLQGKISVLTPEGFVMDINETALEDAHLRRENVIGKPLAQTPWWSLSPTGQAQVEAAIARASTGEMVSFEARVPSQEEVPLQLKATIIPHLNADHQIDYLVMAWIELTIHQQTEADISALIEAIPQHVWMMCPDGSCEYANQRLLHYVGQTMAQTQGDGWLQCLHPDDLQHTLEVWQRSVQTGSPYETEYRVRNSATREYRWFLSRSMPLRDSHGVIQKWIGTCTDIHEKKQAEDEIRAIIDTIPQFVWTMHPDGSCEYCNQRLLHYAGMTTEQIQGDGWQRYVHPGDLHRILPVWQDAIQTGNPYEVVHRLRNGATGEYRWFLARGMPLRDSQNVICRWFGTCTDIDERKQMEQALHQSQERARALMDSKIVGIFICEGDESEIVDANDTFLCMTGYSQEDLCQRKMNYLHMTPPEYLAVSLQMRQERLQHQSSLPVEKEYICKDGSRLPVVVGGVVLQQHPYQNIAVVLDNSARKELEQRKDAFISMASHELKTPLTTLKLQTEVLQRQLAKQGVQIAALFKMEAQINKITRLVEELLDVSKIQAGRLEYVQEPVDLDALLREVVESMQQTCTTHTLIVRGTVPISLHGDRDRLGQVFTNLISNAIKYSPDTKTVGIDLSTAPETATIRVRDYGIGIPSEQRDKIFERFYRASGPQQRAIPGLGMGLYIVAEIVKHHGGTITVESTLGKGSTFTVTFPRKRYT